MSLSPIVAPGGEGTRPTSILTYVAGLSTWGSAVPLEHARLLALEFLSCACHMKALGTVRRLLTQQVPTESCSVSQVCAKS